MNILAGKKMDLAGKIFQLPAKCWEEEFFTFRAGEVGMAVVSMALIYFPCQNELYRGGWNDCGKYGFDLFSLSE